MKRKKINSLYNDLYDVRDSLSDIIINENEKIFEENKKNIATKLYKEASHNISIAMDCLSTLKALYKNNINTEQAEQKFNEIN